MRHQRVQLAELEAGAGAGAVLEAPTGALTVSAGSPPPASLPCSQAYSDIVVALHVTEDVPLNDSIVPMQQRFLD
jgi:hypothetical protein